MLSDALQTPLAVPRPRTMSAASVGGARINVATLKEAVDETMARLANGRGFTFFNLDLEGLAAFDRDFDFRTVVLAADLVSADGWAIGWLAAQQGVDLETVGGLDVVGPICAAAAAKGVPVAFIGPRAKALGDGVEALKGAAPDLKVALAEAPEIAGVLEGDALFELAARLNDSGARLCFVSLGAPKQERLAASLTRLCPHVGFVTLGKALDALAGNVVKPPDWATKYRVEHAWRFSQDPVAYSKSAFDCSLAFGKALVALWL